MTSRVVAAVSAPPKWRSSVSVSCLALCQGQESAIADKSMACRGVPWSHLISKS